MPIISLRNMKKDQEGIIVSLKAKGELRKRIMEMGIVKGTKIQVKGRAPLYDPVSLQVKDFVLTLRNNEADFIEVETSN